MKVSDQSLLVYRAQEILKNLDAKAKEIPQEDYMAKNKYYENYRRLISLIRRIKSL